MYWMITLKIHVFDAYLKKRQIEAILRFGHHFFHGCFLQHFEGCLRVSSFYPNNLDNEVGNEPSSRCHPTTANRIKSILKIVSKLALMEVTKAQL